MHVFLSVGIMESTECQWWRILVCHPHFAHENWSSKEGRQLFHYHRDQLEPDLECRFLSFLPVFFPHTWLGMKALKHIHIHTSTSLAFSILAKPRGCFWQDLDIALATLTTFLESICICWSAEPASFPFWYYLVKVKCMWIMISLFLFSHHPHFWGKWSLTTRHRKYISLNDFLKSKLPSGLELRHTQGRYFITLIPAYTTPFKDDQNEEKVSTFFLKVLP